MISTERFLALLEEKELLSARKVASLRAQIAQAPKPISAESLAKRLVKKGHITLDQAKRLLAAGPTPPSQPEAKPQSTDSDDELGFAPLKDESFRAGPSLTPVTEPPAKKPAAKPKTTEATSKRQETTAPKSATPPTKSEHTGSLLDEETSSPGWLSDRTDVGSLNDILSDASLADAATAGPLAPVSSKGWRFWRAFFRKSRIRKESDQWGSPLMLVGGGTLLVLVILGGALAWSLMRSSGDEMLQLANDDYRAGSYAQAIHKYQAYLEKFPKHSGASVARVRIGLAQLRQATQGAANWPIALGVADEVLTDMAVEPDFKVAHGELASMLAAIAEGLADDARKKPDPLLVDQIRQSLAMNRKYVPKSLRQTSKLADVEASLALTVRHIARGDELEKTVAAMHEAAKQRKTDDAYAAYGALLRQYPTLVDDKKLADALLTVSQTQQTLVETVSDPKPADTSETDTAVLSRLTLAQRDTTANVPDAAGHVALAAVDGALYGLDAATGKLLWRRFIGFDVNPQAPSFPPTHLSPEPGSDVLAVDAQHNEVLCVESATGRLRWRYAIGQPFDAHPVIVRDKILVATRDGTLVTIAVDSGQSPGYIRFPQPLPVAPAVDTRRSLVYQVADHTNLFVLSLADGACNQVVCLGHERGSIATAPVLIGDSLIVAINNGARDATLHVLAVTTDPTNDTETRLKPVQQVRLHGHVLTSPLADGRRVLVTTNQGVIRVFELGAADSKTPLRDIADATIEDADNLIRFALMQDGQFWIADNRLTKYDVQAARGRLTLRWSIDENSTFLQPPVGVGQAVVTVRRDQGMPGAVVSAVSMQDPDSFWQTRLGRPLVGEPLIASNDNQAIAVTSNGALFRFNTNQTEIAVIDEPAAVADPLRLQGPVAQVVPLANGLLAISAGAGSKELAVCNPADQRPRFDWLKLPSELACSPVSFGRGLLVPGTVGQVFLLDPRDGTPLAEPFQPRLEARSTLAWTVPAVIDNEAVLSDGRGRIFRLGVSEQPKPHLATLAEATVVEPVVSSVAVCGNTLYGCDAANVLVAFSLPELTRLKEHPLGSPCAWGPARAGDNVLLTTDDGQLIAMDAAGNRLWQVDLPYGPLAGAPLPIDNHYVLASQTGTIWRIEAATGNELGNVDTARPLATGPVLLGRRLLVGGHDGTLYEVRQP